MCGKGDWVEEAVEAEGKEISGCSWVVEEGVGGGASKVLACVLRAVGESVAERGRASIAVVDL